MLIFGEVGLSGEVRAVSQAGQRVAEAVKMGFTACVLPRANLEKLRGEKRIRLNWSGKNVRGGHRGGIFFFPGFPYG